MGWKLQKMRFIIVLMVTFSTTRESSSRVAKDVGLLDSTEMLFLAISRTCFFLQLLLSFLLPELCVSGSLLVHAYNNGRVGGEAKVIVSDFFYND